MKWWPLTWLLVGCTCGTLSPEELNASYEVMPAEPASELARGVLDSLDDDVRIVELWIGADYASVEFVRPSAPDRIYSTRYDGLFASEDDDFDPLPMGVDGRTVGLAKPEIPVARFDELVARTRGAIDRPLATFQALRVAADGERGGPHVIWVSFDSFREGSASAEYELDGTLRAR